MKRLKHILSILFLVVATMAAAQESYVVDSVCVGADRTYRIDGEKGSTYDWFINDEAGSTIANPVYSDFSVENNLGDTIWGSEIDYGWNDVGEFEILSLHYSEHGCDTLEMGRVKVFELPQVIPGNDQVVCSIDDFQLTGDTVWNHNTFYWETRGDGSFSSTDILHPVYSPGVADSIAGRVTLVLTALGLAENSTCEPVMDSLELIVLPNTTFDSITSICEGDLVADWNGQVIDNMMDNVYHYTTTNALGCDSILSLSVTVLPVAYHRTDSMINEFDPPVAWNDSLYHEAGLYRDTLFTINGCDSIIELDLAVIPNSDTLIYAGICEGDFYAWNDSTYGIRGIYSDTFTNVSGGDSVTTLILTVYEINYSYSDSTINELDPPVVWNDSLYHETGLYRDTLLTVFGCDSIIELDLTVLFNSDTLIYASICEGSFYAWNDSTYGIGGIYSETYTSISGGDSTVRLDLTVSPFLDLVVEPVDVLCFGDSTGSIDLTISGGIQPYSIVWSTGETTEDINNLPAGNYSVWVTDSIGCVDSLDIIIVEPPQLVVSLDNVIDVNVYGESTGGIEVSISGGTGAYRIEWIDESGTVLSNNEDLTNQGAGVYTIEVFDENNCSVTLTEVIVEPSFKVMNCGVDVLLICYEELEEHPVASNYAEFLARDALVEVFSDCGIDTASFKLDSINFGNTFCYEEVRYYSVLDSCGERLSCFHSVVVNDSEKPLLTCPPTEATNGVAPLAYADTSEFIAAGGIMDDNCEIVSFRQVGSDISDGGSNPEIITRVYEVEDFCGNIVQCTQEIHVSLPIDLVIDCSGLPTISYECKAELPEYADTIEFITAGGSVYSDPYDIVWFGYTDSSDGLTCPETITRTFVIRNENGNEASCEVIYVVDDKTPPFLNLPDKHIFCDEDLPAVYQGANALDVVIANHPAPIFDIDTIVGDNCGINSIDYISEDVVEGCPTVITRYYLIDDNCGNEYETSELIYVHDTIAPEIVSTPGDLMVDCMLPEPYVDYPEFKVAGGEVTEDCGDFTMTYIGDSVVSEGLVYRTYRFTDACNYVDYVQKIEIDDRVAPVFTQIPLPFTVDCEPVVFTSWLEFVDANGWATDNCELDTSSFALVSSVTSDGLCPKTYINTYEIFDMSGNRTTGEHTVIVVDIEKPILACPLSDTIAIDESFPAPYAMLDGFIAGGGFASDNCGLDSASFNLASADSIVTDCEKWLTYTYQVADNCGNWSDECSYTIYQVDTVVPQIISPEDFTVECFTEIPNVFANYAEFEAAGGSASDNVNIDELSLVWLHDSILTESCPRIIKRSYQILDVCGNAAVCSYHITIDDKEAPIITCPPDISAECIASVGGAITSLEDFISAGGTFTDNCAIDSSSFEINVVFKYYSDYNERISNFTIKDFCGNEASCQRVFISSDIDAPEVICNSITVVLDSTGNYSLTEIDMQTIVAGSNDSCTAFDDFVITVSTDTFNCEDAEFGKMITVLIQDEAGNIDSCQTQINVLDELPPVALCQDIEVYLDEYGQVLITPDMIDAGSFDNCNLDRLEISKEAFDCSEVGDNTVTLIAYDAYGLSDTCEATVTVYDKIAPYIACIGKTTVQLDENARYELSWQFVTDSVSDNCAVDTVLISRDVLGCEDIGTTFVNVVAYDVNGNLDSCLVEFEVLGNIAPIAENDTAFTAINFPVDINIVENDYDLKTDIDYGTIGVLIEPSHGSVSVDTTTGIVTYTPHQDFEGTDVFHYSVCDDAIPCEPMCDDALVFITVREQNKPPIAINDSFDVPCGSLFGSVFDDNGLGIDYDPDGDDIAVIPIPETHPTNGVVILYTNGNFEYEPFDDFVGIDSFQYIIKDNSIIPITPLYDTAWVYITRVADNDCDGVADIDDIDDDNDGIRDIHEGDVGFGIPKVDSDRDGIPDSFDIDSDNDGIPDNIEAQNEDNYIDPEGWRDENGNGWDDRYDHEEGGYPFDIDLTDTDGDGVPDFLDIDSDNDGVYDYIEGHDDNADGIADVTRIYVDTDMDGLDDAYDTQPGWGLTDNETGSNAPIQDFDSDGTRDWRDTNDEDDEHQTVSEDLNGNGDYSDDDLDLDGHPEYLDTEMECELFIPEGFSPNDDGVHDFFQILCIYPRYPDAKMMIFNRRGQKLWEKEKYGNYEFWGWEEAWWWGTSESRLTIGRTGGLPAGNYIYVLLLGNGEVRNGTVMVAY